MTVYRRPPDTRVEEDGLKVSIEWGVKGGRLFPAAAIIIGELTDERLARVAEIVRREAATVKPEEVSDEDYAKTVETLGPVLDRLKAEGFA